MPPPLSNEEPILNNLNNKFDSKFSIAHPIIPNCHIFPNAFENLKIETMEPCGEKCLQQGICSQLPSPSLFLEKQKKVISRFYQRYLVNLYWFVIIKLNCSGLKMSFLSTKCSFEDSFLLLMASLTVSAIWLQFWGQEAIEIMGLALFQSKLYFTGSIS